MKSLFCTSAHCTAVSHIRRSDCLARRIAAISESVGARVSVARKMFLMISVSLKPEPAHATRRDCGVVESDHARVRAETDTLLKKYRTPYRLGASVGGLLFQSTCTSEVSSEYT